MTVGFLYKQIWVDNVVVQLGFSGGIEGAFRLGWRLVLQYLRLHKSVATKAQASGGNIRNWKSSASFCMSH